MKALPVSLVLVVAGLIATNAIADDVTFAQVATATGTRYVELRKQLLDQGVDPSLLQDKARSSNWNEKVTAIALRGWIANGQKYETLVSSEKVRNLAGEERFVWASDPEQIHAALLPLAYEFLLKDSGGEAGREAATRIIPFLTTQQADSDVQVLFDVLAAPEVIPELRESVASTVSRLPSEQSPPGGFLSLLETETGRSLPDTKVVGHLLNGVVGRAAEADDDEKRAMIAALQSEDKLNRVAGDRQIIHTIGSIGGADAVPPVARFLEMTNDEEEKSWAIRALASIGSQQAAQGIMKALNSRDSSQGIRLMALRNLSTCDYDDSIRDSLGEFMHDERRSPALRKGAYDSLERLLQQNQDDEECAEDIRGLLRGIDPSAFRIIPGARDEG